MISSSLLKKIIIVLLISILIPFAGMYKESCASGSTWQVTFGTMSPTGGYMMLAIGIAKIVNENVEGINITPVPSPRGSQENIEAIDSREREFGLAQCNVVIDAITPRKPFTEKKDIMGWFNAHYAIMWSIATESSGIKTFKDFEGKKVATGLPGSNDEYLAKNVFFPLAGVDVSKVKLQLVDNNTAIDLMKDGHIDAILVTAAPKLGMFEDLIYSRKIRYIDMDEKTLNKVVEEYPEFVVRERTTSHFSDKMILNKQKIKLLTMGHIVLVSPDVDEETMYKLTKAVFEHIKVIHDIQPRYEVITLEDAIKGMPLKLHPGAMRYYKEMGITN